MQGPCSTNLSTVPSGRKEELAKIVEQLDKTLPVYGTEITKENTMLMQTTPVALTERDRNEFTEVCDSQKRQTPRLKGLDMFLCSRDDINIYSNIETSLV